MFFNYSKHFSYLWYLNIEAINKENLLKSNKEIVSTDGFNSLNMRNLALKNNIGLDTIYNYFKT